MNASVINVQDAGTYEYVLKELQPGTAYEIAVLAYNDNGKGPMSAPTKATTEIYCK